MPDAASSKLSSAQRHRDGPLEGQPNRSSIPDVPRQAPAKWPRHRVTGLLLVAVTVAIALANLVAALVWRPLIQPLRPDGSPREISRALIHTSGDAPGP